MLVATSGSLARATAVSLWVSAGLLLSACGSKQAAALEAPPEAESPAAEPSPDPVGEPGDGQEPVSLDRTQDYKAEQLRLAMRGITYEGGKLAIDAEVAPTIAAGPDPAASAGALAEGRALIEGNRRDEAIAAMTRAVLFAPESAAAYEGLGDALTVRRKDPEAAAAFRAGLVLAPESASLHHKLGDSLGRVGELDLSIQELRRAVELDPARQTARERLAVQLYYAGEHAAAWEQVHAAESQGHALPPQMRALLARAYSEPSRNAEEK